LKEFTDELETADSVLCTLGLIVEGRDPYTEGHCERLSVHAADLGRHLGMDDDSLQALKRGGYLHDLGKIAVPDEILKKGSDLTPAEWAVMKLHPITGENICKPLHSLRLVLPIIRHHHEHSDGSGYPDGLMAPEIPAQRGGRDGMKVRIPRGQLELTSPLSSHGSVLGQSLHQTATTGHPPGLVIALRAPRTTQHAES